MFQGKLLLFVSADGKPENKKQKTTARLASLLPKKEVDSKLRDALAEDGRFQVWILGDD